MILPQNSQMSLLKKPQDEKTTKIRLEFILI